MGEKASHKLSHILKVFIVVLAILTILSLQAVQTCAQQPDQTSINEVDFENNTVYIGIWLNNIYRYEYTAGAYIIDFYLYFFWIDQNIETIEWYLLNGYPVNPATTVLVNSNLTGEVKYEIYRITAACSITPDAKDFPFDSIELAIVIEILTHGQNIDFVWLENETGVDPNFVNAGWVTTNIDLTTSNHVYPLDAELPRAEMVVSQQRQLVISSIQGLIPPLIFAVLSAFSFLFNLKDASSVGLRLGLNTSMLVTTLLFNFTIASSVPPSSTITLYGLFIISVLIFTVMNLIVTIAGYVQWFYYKNEQQTKATNRWGFLFSLIVPVVFFLLLYFFRG
ncbi:MAG: hypothetical protein NWF01_10450 [Candidatus Bathyarchaeota archaeon]|nr:hypothetical protein [Candidatus Bathyarchaeota archaeon]